MEKIWSFWKRWVTPSAPTCSCDPDLQQVQRYDSLLNDLNKTMAEIHRSYISVQAPNQINLSQPTMKKLNMNLKKSVTSTMPIMESMFVEAQENVEQLVATDIYPRFVRYQMTMSATKALASDRGKYGGLGDCFCLTNPAYVMVPYVFNSCSNVRDDTARQTILSFLHQMAS